VPIHGHRRNGDQRAAGVLSRSWIRTHRRLPVKTFMALVERNRGPSLGLRQLDDINTVEIICLPIGHDGRIATVIGDEKAGELWDRGVLPGHDDKSIPINRGREFVSERVEICDTGTCIDR